MTDTILTILGVGLYIPFFIQLFRTHWTRTGWTKELVLLSLMLELTSILHLPSVMYCCAGVQWAALVLYWIVERPSFRWKPFFILSLLYLLYFGIALLWSANPVRGAQFLIDNGMPLVAFSITASLVSFSQEEWKRVLKTFCWAALIFLGLALLSWGFSCAELHISPLQWPILRKEHIGGIDTYRWLLRFNSGLMGYAHPSYDLLPLFAAACSSIWLGKTRTIHPSITGILCAGCLILSLLTQSRMGLTFSAILIVFAILSFIPTLRQRLITGGVILAVGIVGLMTTRTVWLSYSSDPIREQLYSFTWRYILAKPWTGAGTGSLNPIEICHTINEPYWPHIGYIAPEKDVRDWPWKTRMLPHNQWMADWSHAGIVAAFITLLLYICIIVECSRRRIYWGLIFMLIFIIFSCLEPPLYIGKGLYLFGSLSIFFQTYPKREQ